jgi:hypothetical protein
VHSYLTTSSPLQVVSQKMLDYGQVVLATDNLFSRCRARSKIVHAPSSCPLAQMDIIANYVGDLGAILRQYHDDQSSRKGGQGRAADD